MGPLGHPKRVGTVEPVSRDEPPEPVIAVRAVYAVRDHRSRPTGSRRGGPAERCLSEQLGGPCACPVTVHGNDGVPATEGRAERRVECGDDVNEGGATPSTSTPSRRRLLAGLGAAGVFGLAGCSGDPGSDPLATGSPTDSPTPGPTATDEPTATDTPEPTETPADPTLLWVAPDGDDDAAATEDDPLRTFDEAVNSRADPGDTVRAKPGVYRQFLTMRQGGEPGAPITITGPPDAVLCPDPGGAQILRIHHSHVHLTGLTIDGLLDPERKFETLDAWASIGIQISPYAPFKEETPAYLTDVVIEPHRIGGARGTLVAPTRIRNASIGGFEVTAPAGMAYDPRMPDTREGHNRELVYIGTSPGNLDEPNYPWDGLDRTRNVRVHGIDNSAGHAHSELVDIKVGSTDVTTEYCTDRGGGAQTDDNPAGAVSVKGNRCTVRWNDLAAAPYTLEFDPYYPGGDAEAWGQDNAIYGNHLHGFSEAAVRFPDYAKAGPEEQRVFCGNRIEDGLGSYPYATGECGADVPKGDGVGYEADSAE